MSGGQTGDGALRHMDRHRDAVILRHVPDFFRLEDASGRQHVRMDDRHPAGFEERLEVLLQINVFPRTDRCRHGARETGILIRILPRNHILHPGQIELVDTFA
ncbi:hypothetical protein D3C81_1422560 [compost metagenome]